MEEEVNSAGLKDERSELYERALLRKKKIKDAFQGAARV